MCAFFLFSHDLFSEGTEGREGKKKNHKCICKATKIFKFSLLSSYIFSASYVRWKIKTRVREINCDDERMLGSCLRNENNKGINYCRHHQDRNDTALCTRFPWQPAKGRWMFHSRSVLRRVSINQTCIKSTRRLLWAVLGAGLFSCCCIITDKKHKAMRSLFVGHKLRNH